MRWLPHRAAVNMSELTGVQFLVHQNSQNMVAIIPISRGTAPMAFCRARISSVGPVMRDVPVSRMAAQPRAQRVRPVAT